MKRVVPIFGLLSLVACSAATTPPAASPGASPRQCTRVSWLEAGKPLLKATVNGRELTFLVDTGAEYDGWIKPEVAKELGLPVVGEVPTSEEDDGTGGLPFYGVDTLTIGTMRFNGRRLAETPQVGRKPQPFDGIIGNGLFAQLQVVFDYHRGALLLTDRPLADAPVASFDKYGIPLLTLDIGGHPVVVNLDTGNLASRLFVTGADAKVLPLAGEPVKKGRAMTVSGPFDIMEAPLAAPVRYGSTTLPITMVRFPGAYDGGQLGSQGLVGQTVRIDWRNRRVSIGPETIAPGCP